MLGLFFLSFAQPAGRRWTTTKLPLDEITSTRSFFLPYTHKKKRSVFQLNASKIKPGIVLLSHSKICSTIAAGVLNIRVREGNVCNTSAMDTG